MYSKKSVFNTSDTITLVEQSSGEYQITYGNHFYSMCTKNTIKKALKPYKKIEEDRDVEPAQRIPQYFGKYFGDFPELFI